MIRRFGALLYGAFAYLVFLASLLYAVGFVGNFVVPKSVDLPAESTGPAAWVVNLVLLSAFAVQHSGMARQGFKRWWTRFVPQPIERSTYVLVSSLLLLFIFWQWRPLNAEIWSLSTPAGAAVIWTLFALGWLVVFASSLMIDHFDLFGLRQTWLYSVGRDYSPPAFRTPWAYRYVRHPIMLGFLIAFWATPIMTAGHLLFAIANTVYVVIAVQLEERDLVSFYGDAYRAYQQRTRTLVPWPKKH